MRPAEALEYYERQKWIALWNFACLRLPFEKYFSNSLILFEYEDGDLYFPVHKPGNQAQWLQKALSSEWERTDNAEGAEIGNILDWLMAITEMF